MPSYTIFPTSPLGALTGKFQIDALIYLKHDCVTPGAESERTVRLVLLVTVRAAVALKDSSMPLALGNSLKATDFVGDLARPEPRLEDQLVASREDLRDALPDQGIEGFHVGGPALLLWF
jgi:hypothetical protein